MADAPPAAPDEWARWEVLADEIRMQVLQRIDIFTDTGLRDQLSAQLQPIVDRASAEMVSTINEHIGGLCGPTLPRPSNARSRNGVKRNASARGVC